MEDTVGSGGRLFEPILRTKLHRPQPNAELIDRDRLITVMNAAREVPLTLVSAPAGYGKSVLVAQWAEQLDRPIAWLSLDASDSELRSFLQYFLAAVDTAFPGACDTTRELLAPGSLAPMPVLAGYLLNDLDAIDAPCSIVLDDYHRIEPTSPVHGLMLRMLEHPPAKFHFVVATRQDPPFDLPSLRAAHRMNEVRLQDLQFTGHEMREFLNATADDSVSDEAIAHIEREVEGWVAGLRLVSLALRQVRDADAFLKRLPGRLPEIQEYLLQEVLAGQAAEVRDRLLASSILDRFCTKVVDAVCGPPGTHDQTSLTAPDQPLHGPSRCAGRVVSVSPPLSRVARGRAAAPARSGARRGPTPAGQPVVRRRRPDRRSDQARSGSRRHEAGRTVGHSAPTRSPQ